MKTIKLVDGSTLTPFTFYRVPSTCILIYVARIIIPQNEAELPYIEGFGVNGFGKIDLSNGILIKWGLFGGTLEKVSHEDGWNQILIKAGSKAVIYLKRQMKRLQMAAISKNQGESEIETSIIQDITTILSIVQSQIPSKQMDYVYEQIDLRCNRIKIDQERNTFFFNPEDQDILSTLQVKEYEEQSQIEQILERSMDQRIMEQSFGELKEFVPQITLMSGTNLKGERFEDCQYIKDIGSTSSDQSIFLLRNTITNEAVLSKIFDIDTIKVNG